jgi:hypothetical protein
MRAAAGLSGGSQVRSNSEGESKFKGGAALDTNLVPELAVGNASWPSKRRRGFDEPIVRYRREGRRRRTAQLHERSLWPWRQVHGAGHWLRL